VLGELGFDAQVAVKIETRRAVDNIEELAQCGDYKNGKPRPSGRGWEKDLKNGSFCNYGPLLGAGDPRCWPG
jgi:hypothetical protein